MGNQGSRSGRDVAAFHQGLELLGRGALLVAENSPQLVGHWQQVEERLQRVETNVLTLQRSVDRIEAQLERVEGELKKLGEKDGLRNAEFSTLQTCIDKALDTVFPRVDALLNQLESPKNVKSEKEKKIVGKIPGSSADVNTVIKNQFTLNSNIEKFEQKSESLSVQQVSSSSFSLPPESVHSTRNHSQYEDWGEGWMGEWDNALLDAAKEGRVGDVHYLVASGANINTENVQQRTPLMLAAYEGHAECLSMLLKLGADAGCRDMNEFFPLHAAACRGHESAVRVLVEAGVDINIRDGVTGSTALVLAASKGHAECVFTLLQNNANVDVQDDDGMTSLHRAVMYGHASCVSLLLQAGADVNCLDNRGWSPRNYAFRSGTAEVRQVLSERCRNNEEERLNAVCTED